MSTDLQLLILVIGLDSLVSLHLLVIGVVMALMRKRPKYWRMFGAGLALAVLPLLVYTAVDYPESGSALVLTGGVIASVALVYAVLVMVKGQLNVLKPVVLGKDA